MRDWIENRPKDKFGKHDYAAEDFGLSEAEIDQRFAAYRARFGV